MLDFFKPNSSDVRYVQEKQLVISLICRMDSYKFSHPFAYPNRENEQIVGMTSYGTARVESNKTIIPAGMQLLIKKYLSQRITMEDIEFANEFSINHFGRPLFKREAWVRVVKEFNGYLPLIIRSVPEGTPIRGGQPIYTVTCLDESLEDNLFWMSAAFETMIQRGVWYPTTIATNDYNIKKRIKDYYILSGADLGMLPFALHDFGGRGVSSGETAEIGGFAHTINFSGSDTIEGILTSNFYYNEKMAGYSVYATEHSIQCSFGESKENAVEYIRHQLNTAKELGVGIVSIVLDGYDVYREAAICCNELREDIINSGLKVVFRPDSGDMMVVVPKILEMQEKAFGYTINKEGFKNINNVGIIQGDGVDSLAIINLLGLVVTSLRYSADSVIFGSGGALLQKVNRDTLKFAQKACAILVKSEDGIVWRGISKNPVTDKGKKSLEGVLSLARNKINNELMTVRLDQGPLDSEWEDIMKLVYFKGELYNETSLSEIKDRVAL